MSKIARARGSNRPAVLRKSRTKEFFHEESCSLKGSQISHGDN